MVHSYSRTIFDPKCQGSWRKDTRSYRC